MLTVHHWLSVVLLSGAQPAAHEGIPPAHSLKSAMVEHEACFNGWGAYHFNLADTDAEVLARLRKNCYATRLPAFWELYQSQPASLGSKERDSLAFQQLEVAEQEWAKRIRASAEELVRKQSARER